MKRSCAAALCAALLVVALVGESVWSRRLSGVWRYEMDLTEQINTGFVAHGMDRYIRTDGFFLPVNVTVDRHGTYTAAADPEALDLAVEALCREIRTDLSIYVGREIVEGQGVEMTEDEVLAALGLTMDDLMNIALGGWSISDLAALAERSGQYQAKGGKLWWSLDPDQPPTEGGQPYVIRNGVLTLGWTDWPAAGTPWPMELTRLG